MAKKKKNYKIKWGRLIIAALVLVALVAGLVWGIYKITHLCKHTNEDGTTAYVDGVCQVCGKACKHKHYTEGICDVCGSKDPNYVFPDTIVDLSIICGGDVMAHPDNLMSASNHEDADEYFYNYLNCYFYSNSTFDFSDNYKYISKFLKAADVSMVNVETTFSTGGPRYSGYWGGFCAPDALAQNLYDAGFNVAAVANNHAGDYNGYESIVRTNRVLKNAGFTVIGSRLDRTGNSTPSSVVEYNGVKVGLVNFTYETVEYSEYGGHALNGVYLSDSAAEILNTFRYIELADGTIEVCQKDKEKVKTEIDWCKENGADIVIAYFHWDQSNEYVLEPTHLERDLAQYAADNGVDVVLGSHPHRVCEAEIIEATREDGSKASVPVYYSLGNLVSNQRYETMLGDPPYDNPYATEQSILAYLQLKVNVTQKKVETITSMKAIPLYLDKFYDDAGSIEYRIYPVVGDMNQYDELVYSGNVWRAEKALADITEVLGSDMIYTEK